MTADGSKMTLESRPLHNKSLFIGSCKQCIDATHWTQPPANAICGQLWGTEIEFTRLFFFGIWMGKLSGPGLSVHWPDWGEIEWGIWAARWVWPQPFYFCSLLAAALSAQPRRYSLGTEDENIVGMESLQLLSIFFLLFILTHLSSLWFIVPSHSLSWVQCLHFRSLRTHTHTRACLHTWTGITRHFSLSSTLPLLLLFHRRWFQILGVLACLLSSPHHLLGGSRRVYRPGWMCVEA